MNIIDMVKTRAKIIEYIKINHFARPEDLRMEFGLSRRAIFKQLENLLSANILGKRGTPPLVVYFIKENDEILPKWNKTYSSVDLDSCKNKYT